MSTVNEIVELSEKICNRIDQIIAMDRKMNHEMISYLEHIGWNMQKQTEDIKEVYERFGE